jgi:hypothetical protein
MGEQIDDDIRRIDGSVHSGLVAQGICEPKIEQPTVNVGEFFVVAVKPYDLVLTQCYQVVY